MATKAIFSSTFNSYRPDYHTVTVIYIHVHVSNRGKLDHLIAPLSHAPCPSHGRESMNPLCIPTVKRLSLNAPDAAENLKVMLRRGWGIREKRMAMLFVPLSSYSHLLTPTLPLILPLFFPND
jgi:hypothetical protein